MAKKTLGGKKKAKAQTTLGLAPREWLFLAKFFVFFSVPYVLIHLIDLGWLSGIVAVAETALFNAAGIPSSASGSQIFCAGMNYAIIADCTGLVMIFMLFALLWATPLKGRRRWLFLAVGIPLLLIFNIFRLFLTLYAGVAFGAGALDAVHLGFWFVDAGVVVALWAKAAELW